MMMDFALIKEIRSEFPALEDKIYGKKLIYFDNSATTQRPRCVVEKLMENSYHKNANIHRGVHYLSQRATEAHEEARKCIAGYINAAGPEEVLFTRGTTEGINAVAYSFGETYCTEGDEVIVSEMEHHSNIVPWQLLCDRKKMKLKVIPISDKGELLLEEFDKLLTSRVKIVSIAHVSNVLGTINPVKEIIKRAHAKNIPVMVDGAQSAPHMKIDVQDMDADFYAFSAHKIYGPTGMGALYGKRKYLEEMVPYQGGGEMIDHVSFKGTTWNELPYKFEAGTPDFIGSVAFAEAVRFVDKIGIDNIALYEKELLDYATKKIKGIDGIKIYGESEDKGAVLSFLYKDSHPFDVGTLLDHLGIAVRTGHHCAQPLMEHFGIKGTVRASFSVYNTFEEIDEFIKAMERISGML